MVMTMQGSLIMDSLLLRQKLGLCLSSPSNQTNMTGNATTARCLFGPPDPKKATDLVKEVEQKSAFQFGKRFNFLIENGDGEPNHPPSKKMRMTDSQPIHDSDEENNGPVIEEEDEECYIWTETYDDQYMAICNKYAANSTRLIGPNRLPVPLLIAPVALSNNQLYSSRLSPTTPATPSISEETSSDKSAPTTILAPSEPNNNNICGNKNLSSVNCKTSMERYLKRYHRNNNPHHHHTQSHHQPSAKKTTSLISSACHHILTKYTNRTLRNAVLLKKPRKSVITDYLQMRRTKSVNSRAGKK